MGAAGPVSNFVLAIIFAFLVWIFKYFPVGDLRNTILIVLMFGALINIVLAMFNLIPVPPLDGSQILSGFLPTDLAIKYDRIAPYGFMIIIFLFFTGIIWAVIVPIVVFLFRVLFMGIRTL